MALKIVAVSGSLRKASVNTGLLRYAAFSAPENVSIQVYVPDLPLFSEDIEKEEVLDDRVREWRRIANEADAFLFASPEHNFSVSAAMKVKQRNYVRRLLT